VILSTSGVGVGVAVAVGDGVGVAVGRGVGVAVGATAVAVGVGLGVSVGVGSGVVRKVGGSGAPQAASNPRVSAAIETAVLSVIVLPMFRDSLNVEVIGHGEDSSRGSRPGPLALMAVSPPEGTAFWAPPPRSARLQFGSGCQ
jgi:hypothetical protein